MDKENKKLYCRLRDIVVKDTFEEYVIRRANFLKERFSEDFAKSMFKDFYKEFIINTRPQTNQDFYSAFIILKEIILNRFYYDYQKRPNDKSFDALRQSLEDSENLKNDHLNPQYHVSNKGDSFHTTEATLSDYE